MKNLAILGSSGSIGQSALRVVEAMPARFRICGLAVKHDYKRLLQQAEKFGVRHVAVADPAMAPRCRSEAPPGIVVHEGPEGVLELIALENVDIVLCAVVGLAGLRPVLAAAERGIAIALATKEALVAAGDIVTRTCARTGARLLPVDSEHSAIFQCLLRAPSARIGEGLSERVSADIRRIILTASGGPFESKPNVDLERVTVEEVLDHPRWRMGKKVTVDSATLMNKGLEIIEAHWLFGMPIKDIAVVIHPESVIHSMVEFIDGNVLAQLSVPDMRFAIQYALTYPDRVEGKLPPLNLAKVGALHFREPDRQRFPCLQLAIEAGLQGGTLPAVLNAANEVAVHRFLEKRIGFLSIGKIVERVMEKHEVIKTPDLGAVLQADEWARRCAGEQTC